VTRPGFAGGFRSGGRRRRRLHLRSGPGPDGRRENGLKVETPHEAPSPRDGSKIQLEDEIFGFSSKASRTSGGSLPANREIPFRFEAAGGTRMQKRLLFLLEHLKALNPQSAQERFHRPFQIEEIDLDFRLIPGFLAPQAAQEGG